MSYIYTMADVEKSTLQIFTTRGELVSQYELFPDSKTLEIDLSDQATGIYVYRLMTNGVIYAGSKIVLQK